MNKAKAFRHFQLAAEQGDNKAMTDLAIVYVQGEGCQRDLNAAKQWLEAASKLENAKAMCLLSFFLSATEYGFDLDFPRAKDLILRSAELGFPDAQAKCGWYYLNGEKGFEADLDKAIDYLSQASEQGDVDSMMELGAALMKQAERDHGQLNLPGHSPMPLAINWMRRGGKLGDDQAKRRANLTVEHFMKKSCAGCGAPSADNGGSVPLKNCVRCKVTFYCGKSCQVQHWKDGHKKDCCKFMG